MNMALASGRKVTLKVLLIFVSLAPLKSLLYASRSKNEDVGYIYRNGAEKYLKISIVWPILRINPFSRFCITACTIMQTNFEYCGNLVLLTNYCPFPKKKKFFFR